MTQSMLNILARTVERYGRAYWQSATPIETTKNESTGALLELLYRAGTFQIERVTHGPFEVVPLHRHPNIDSYEFPLWGSGEIWLGRHHYDLDDAVTPWRGLFISCRTWHGGQGKDRGGAFLSVQFWHGPIKGSVVTDWESKDA